MKLAIISDIHEDIAGLEKAFKKIDQCCCDKVICLGDITGYSPIFHSHRADADACLDMIRAKVDITIAGNHDLYTSARLPEYFRDKNIPSNWYDLDIGERIKSTGNKIWLYLDEIKPSLNLENQNFLNGLKEWEILEADGKNYLFTHFFHPDASGIARWFPFHSLEIKDHFKFMDDHACSFSFVGHSHPPAPVMVNRLYWRSRQNERFVIRQHHKAMICPAIIAKSLQGSFVVFDTKKCNIEVHFV